jgi:hypothetical protein
VGGSGQGALSSPANACSFTAGYHDFATGANGSSGSLCNAVAGYDFFTGLGTSVESALIPALVVLR